MHLGVILVISTPTKGSQTHHKAFYEGGTPYNAFHNAFHQLLTAPSVEEGLARTVSLGGDTDTNAAIAGALLGAAHGARSLPLQWVDRVLTCRPLAGAPGVHRPRPRWCWPVDALFLAERLVSLGARAAAPAAR